MSKGKYAKKQVKKSRQTNKLWIWIIVIALLGGAATAGGYLYKKRPAAKTTPPTVTTATYGQPDTGKKEQPKEGEVANVKFQVKSVSAAKTYGENALTKATASGTFKIIRIAITNNQKSPIDIDSSLFKLTDDQNRVFTSSVEAQTAALGDGSAKKTLDLKLGLNPGVTVEGDIVFDVPANAKGLVLVARAGMGGKDVKIKLE